MMEPLTVYTEVTSTLQVPWTTGVQRAVRELLQRLGDDPRFILIPVTWCDGCRGYRALTASEHDVLIHPRMGPSRATSDGPFASRVMSRAKSTVSPFIPRQAKRAAKMAIATFRHEAGHQPMPHSEWRADAVFFEIEAGWQCPRLRSRLLPELRARGVRIVTIINDVMPITHPQWFKPGLTRVFTAWFSAHRRHSSHILAISDFTAAAVRSLGATQPVSVIHYGADFGSQSVSGAALPSGVRDPFVLCVATLEPRKNHAVLLDAFELTWREQPDAQLVLVGRRGWHVESLIERIRTHPRFTRELLWLDTVDDPTLLALYSAARCVAVPSWCEGLGLPVIEGLQRGAPVVSSNTGALPEAGAGHAVYLAPSDVNAWSATLLLALGAGLPRPAGYEPPRWETAATEAAMALLSVGPPSQPAG